MFPKPKTENKCMCMFETNCVRINDHITELCYSVFFGLSDIHCLEGVHRRIATTLFKHLPINKKAAFKIRLSSFCPCRSDGVRVLNLVQPCGDVWGDWWSTDCWETSLKLRNYISFTVGASVSDFIQLAGSGQWWSSSASGPSRGSPDQSEGASDARWERRKLRRSEGKTLWWKV